MSVRDVTTYERLVESWTELSRSRSFSLRQVPCPGTDRALLLAEFGRPSAPVVHITAGVHGDEPAGPWALFSIVRDGLLDQRFAYRVWPCTNPSGYVAGTRVNAEGNDVNRSFNVEAATPESLAIMSTNAGSRFELSLDLHEDFEAVGFYCYEPIVDGSAPLSAAIIAALEAAGLPLQELDHHFDLGYPKDAVEAERFRRLEPGRVLVNATAERRFPGLPLSLYLLRTATRRNVTLETPRTRAWGDRIAMHRIGVVAALAQAIELRAN